MSNTNTGGPAFPVGLEAFGEDKAGMTLRQYAAIHLKVPDSGTDWLDDMIRQSMSHGIIEYSIEETTAGDSSDAK
jgi:hypothetical protein